MFVGLVACLLATPEVQAQERQYNLHDQRELLRIEQILRRQPHDVQTLLYKLELLERHCTLGQDTGEIQRTADAIFDKDCRPEQLQGKYNVLCSHYGHTRRPEEAIAFIKKAYRLTHSPLCLGYLGGMYERQNDFTRALVYFRRENELAPGSVRTLCQLSNCEGRLGHLNKALAIVESALRIKPADPESAAVKLPAEYIDAHKLKGALLCALGNMPAAAREAAYLQRPLVDRDCSIDDLRSLGARYCRDLPMYLRQSTSGWELADTARLEKINAALKTEANSNKRVRLLEERANLQIVSGNYTAAINDVDALIGMDCGTYQVHALKAAALLGLKKNVQARAERALAVKLFQAAKK